jgi:aspartate/glutamate racemase
MIGGMSWESSLEYYRIINEAVKARLGGLYSAQTLMWSFDFADIESLQASGRWDDATARMIAAAQRLEQKHALTVLTPNAEDRTIVNHIIYEELVLGQIKPESKAEYVRVIQGLIATGAQGIILGCTEIMLLIQQADCAVPAFDTTKLHALAAVAMAVNDV